VILDCCFVSKENAHNFQANVGPPLGKSDHNSVYIYSSSKKPTSVNHYHELYDFRASNIEHFNAFLMKTDWNEMYELNTVNEMLNFYQNRLHKGMELIPKTIVRTNSTDKMWMTPLCKNLINKRWKAFRQNDFILYNHYKEKVQNEIKKAKAMWYSKCKNEKGGMWNIVKKTAPKRKENIETLKENNESIEGLCNRINNSLLSIHDTSHDNSSENYESKVPNLNITVSESDVFNELMKLKKQKAIGSDCVPNRLLIESVHLIYKPIHFIFNCILHSSSYPLLWKQSDIIPLPKSSQINISQLRPISLLPNMSKVFEKIILKYLQPYFSNFINKNQHGFMPKHSTSTCLISIQDKITQLLDRSEISAVTLVSFDLKKAFDLVPHHLLLQKLSSFIPQNILILLRNYLSNRTQRVRIKSIRGSLSAVPAGVPQGSILSPILFNCFFNDLQFTADSTLYKYADDATLIIPHYVNNISSKINDHINEMSFWCASNSLKLNKAKTQIMTIKKSASLILHPLHCNQMKILGVIFDERLKWKNQILSILKKSSQRIYLLRQLKSYLSKHELLIVYKSLIQSVMLYACHLYIKLPQSLETHLTKIARRCHKIICHPTCSCDIIECPSSLRQKYAIRLFEKAANDPSHPVFHLIPSKLNYSKKFSQPYCATERRKLSFIPTITEIINTT